MEENNDPFTGEPPQPSQSYDPEVPDRWRSAPLPNDIDEPRPLTSREKSKIYDQELKKRKKKKRRPREERKDPLNDTYSLDKGEGRGDSQSGPRQRQGSAKSTGTYVVDSDQKKLLESELTRPSSVDMSLSSPKMVEAQSVGQTNLGYSGKIKIQS